MTRIWVAAIIIAGAFTLCCGCADKFDRQRYETIYIGQPKDSVHRVLGAPQRSENDKWIYVNDTPYYMAEITFRDGKVVEKNWSYFRDDRLSDDALPGESRRLPQ